MKKKYQSITLIFFLIVTLNSSAHYAFFDTLKQASRERVRTIATTPYVVGSLGFFSVYCAVRSFIKAAKFRTKKEVIQNSIPFLKQCINDLKKRVIKKQILLGDEWYVYIVYDKVYDELLNHDSIEYKRLKKYYAQEKSYSRKAALSVIISVLCGMRLAALYKEQ